MKASISFATRSLPAGFPILFLSFHLPAVIFPHQLFTINISSNGEAMNTLDKWLAIYELANYIKMNRAKLYGMAQRGDIPASKIGNQWRFDCEEINQWMKTHATGNGS